MKWSSDKSSEPRADPSAAHLRDYVSHENRKQPVTKRNERVQVEILLIV